MAPAVDNTFGGKIAMKHTSSLFSTVRRYVVVELPKKTNDYDLYLSVLSGDCKNLQTFFTFLFQWAVPTSAITDSVNGKG